MRLFTTVGPVIDAAVALLPIFAATLLGDATYTALMALLRGAGKQKASQGWGAGWGAVRLAAGLAGLGNAVSKQGARMGPGAGRNCQRCEAAPNDRPSPFPVPLPCQWGALSNIVSYWLLAIPLAHHLAFARDWGLPGLWVGAATANTFQARASAGLQAVLRQAGGHSPPC